MNRITFFFLSFLCLDCLAFAQTPKLNVHFFDVGYGDSILIQFEQTNILVDAADKEHSKDVLSNLEKHGVDHLDAVIITHPHKNHFEGFFDVLPKFPIKRAYINGDTQAEEGYAALLEEFSRRHIEVLPVRRGDQISELSDDISIKVLNPSDLSRGTNENSIALFVTYKEVSILLTADIGPEEQKEILKEFPEIKQAQCIQVPHHGGALSEEFIKEFEGKIFVISSGKNPNGESPHPDSMRLKGEVYPTEGNGSMNFITDGQGWELK